MKGGEETVNSVPQILLVFSVHVLILYLVKTLVFNCFKYFFNVAFAILS